MTRAATAGAYVGPLEPRADPLGGGLLIVAGLLGLLQVALPWLTVGEGLDGTYTGWQLFQAGRDQSLDLARTVATFASPLVAIVGGSLFLLGLAAMIPMDHRPIGAAAMLFSIGAVLLTIWWILATRTPRGGLGPLLEATRLGWYLFAATGVLGMIGSAKTLADG